MDSHELMGVKVTVWCTLVFLSLPVSASSDQIKIRAEPGQTVVLPCPGYHDFPLSYIKWTRTVQKTESILMYSRNEYDFDGKDQPPSFESRVELRDKGMKDGDLILKNVMTEDAGTYKCRYIPETFCIRGSAPRWGTPVHLTVGYSCCGAVNIRPTDANAKTSTAVNSDKGGEAGDTEDGGDKDEEDKDLEAKIGADYILRNKTGWNTFGRGRDAVNRHGAVRLAVSVLVIYLLVVFAVGCCFVMYRQSKLNSYRPPHGKALVYQWT